MNRITKISVLLFVFSLTVLLTHESLAAGFSLGNEINVTPISGSVYLHCPADRPGGFPTNTFVSCAATLWSPDLADYFVGPKSMDANKVTLVATRADGSKREKSSDYDGAKGKSKSRFNLGISTLTQRPLLKEGLNKIHFVLSHGDVSVEEGDFDVTVEEQREMRCSTADYWAPSSFECQNTSMICDRYFDQQNNCQ